VVDIDPRAASGFANAVEAYERGRPSYPIGVVDALVRELGLTEASTVLDLAAGTGKLARLLVPRVGRVIAVDPSRAMLAEVRERAPSADTAIGSAEAIPLPDGSVDAVFVGQAFHWFRAAEACREIARVLVADGGLALLWNTARWGEHSWSDALDALVTPHRHAAGPFPAGEDRWKIRLEESGLFRPLAQIEAEHVNTIDLDEFVALVASWSWIANLPDEQRAALLADVRRLLGDRATFALRYHTDAYWTRLT
jgi:SAM-dependent methyltransferase